MTDAQHTAAIAARLDNRAWRLANLYWIEDADGRKVKFRMNWAQRKFFTAMWWLNVVLKARQLGLCQDPNTRVLTGELKWKRIADLAVGERLVAVDEMPPGGRGAGRKMRMTTVEAKASIFAQAFELTFDDGRKLIATAEHRYLSHRRGATDTLWLMVKDLRLGDAVRWVTKPCEDGLAEDGWMGGIIDGDLPGKRSGIGRAKIVQIEMLDRREMIDIQTGTKTFIAEGFVSHNSTISIILMLDRCLFNDNQTCGIVDKTDDAAKRKLARIEFAYDHLDDPDDPSTSSLGALVKQAVKMLKNNDKEIEFTNASKVWASTSLRGGTVQFLLVSELGHIAFYNPMKAQEIKTGALNTVHKGNIVVIESTHEGGKYGVNYDMLKLAQQSPAEPPDLTIMDWRAHFFSWHQNPDYVLPLETGQVLTLPPDLHKYFSELEKPVENRATITLSDAQKHWYLKKRGTQGDAMWKEFPSTPEEAVNAVVRGAIYGRLISRLREQKRITDFNHDPSVPLFAFWDIGYSDFTSIWLLQLVGRDICALRYFCRNEEAAPYYVARCLEWEREYDLPIAMHYLPHDADKKEGMGSAKSTKDFLIEAGLDRRRVKVVPRTPDLWKGINDLRVLLPRFYFHATNCGQEWLVADQRLPSGIACLENYHTKEETMSGMAYDTPVHDASSHGADSLRTFAEAHGQSLLEGISTTAREARRAGHKVLRGPGPDSYGQSAAKVNRVMR